MTCGVYLLQIKNRKYVGHSINIEKRFTRHLRDLRVGCHGSVFFQRVYDKYGILPKLSILWEAKGIFQATGILVLIEQCYMNIFNSELNMLPANQSRKGFKASEKTKAKLRESHKNKGAKNFTLYHPSKGYIHGFNLDKFCKENNLSSGAICDVLKGNNKQSKLYFKSEEDYIDFSSEPFSFPGVDKVKNKYKSRVKKKKKVWHLGYFNTAHDAYEARIIALNIIESLGGDF
jgi:group I intron endonuclease